MNYYCKVCNQAIHPKRVKMGYKTTCVTHSSAQKYSGNIVADSKATTWVEVVKDPETAQHITELSRTRGKI